MLQNTANISLSQTLNVELVITPKLPRYPSKRAELGPHFIEDSVNFKVITELNAGGFNHIIESCVDGKFFYFFEYLLN